MPVENQLRSFRTNHDLTQEELAIEVGVSRQTINAIETGKYNPSLELALQLAEYFGVPPEDVFHLSQR